jgi:hypothetical protein
MLFATLLLAASTASAAANNPLLGSWRLVAAIPGNMQDSSPNGIRNLRLRFGADGKAVLVDPSETLSQSTTRNAYSVDGNTLTLQIGEGEELHGAIETLPGDGRSITYLESGMTWSLRRIPDAAIETQKLPPESVQYIPPATLAEVEAYKYDESDDSQLPNAQRVVGQWEVVEISGYGAGDFPPYGAPNEVWILDGKQLTRHDFHHPKEPVSSEYHVAGDALLGKGGAIPFSFDAWGRLVIGDEAGERTVMKRITHDAKRKLQMPPVRIVLGYPAQ